MKLTDKNINNILTDIDTVIKDVLIEQTAFFEKIRFKTAYTLYDGITFKCGEKTVYVELNKENNCITLWVKDAYDARFLSEMNLDFVSRISIPAWVLYQISNI